MLIGERKRESQYFKKKRDSDGLVDVTCQAKMALAANLRIVGHLWIDRGKARMRENRY